MPFSFFNFSFPQEITSKEKEMYFNEVEFYFPKDLQLSTWRFLSPIELCCVSRVCKSFNQTSSLDELWVNFVKPPKEITKDYKNYFIQKMKQSWERFFNSPAFFPFSLSEKLLDEKVCPNAKHYIREYPQLFSSQGQKSRNPNGRPADYDLLFKISITGQSSVGKTSLIERYCEGNFFEYPYVTTLGIDFKIKTIEIGGRVIKLQIWDTAGQERFRTIASSYYRGAHGIFIVGDTTDPKSLEDMKKAWRPEIEKCASPDVSILYCLNKSDLKELSPEEVETFIPKNEKWIQTSAKTGENVDEMFETMARMILNRMTGFEPEICWDDNWASENLHTVIPNLDSHLNQIENKLKQNLKHESNSNSICQIQ